MKEPWLAVFLSAIYPGFGQIYSDRKIRGVVFLITQTIFICVTLFFIVGFVNGLSPFYVLPAIAISVLFQIYNLFDAHHIATAHNSANGSSLPIRKKDPFLAVFLSACIPGAGQIYNGQLIKGILLGAFVLVVSALSGWLGFLVGECICLFVLLDAYRCAEKINAPQVNIWHRWSKEKIFAAIVVFLLLPNLVCTGFTVGIREYLLKPYKIPVNSMLPTIKQGDRVFVNKLIYRSKDPKQGDLVVFKYPAGSRKMYLKRIAGLPGEKLKIEKGHIYIDEKILETPQFPKERYYTNRDNWPFGASGKIIEIPQDSYFVLGDNSASSADSRLWGFIPRNTIEGKAFFVYWPPNRFGKLEEN